MFLGAVALESVGGGAAVDTAGRDVAAALAGRIAADLARLLPAVADLDLVLAGALFDPAELLRPGWPVHAALARLAARAPAGSGPRVLAFGAVDGRMGDPALQPDPRLGGGPLRLLPWLLTGDAGQIAGMAAQLEALLLERGMADAATALDLQSAFGAALEHVRHATIHDLCALTAMQYRHAALEGTWTLLESALLHGGEERYSDADGPPLLLRGTRAWIGTLSADTFAREAATGAIPSAPAFGYWQMRERQLAAVLAAHGLRVLTQPIDALASAATTLRNVADGTPSL